MARAVAHARPGLGATYPNPCVGALIVRRGKLIGKGRSAPTGGPHAEVRAIAQAGSAARGATMYVTLEPCSHVGRTGPCTKAIAEAGIARVVVGIVDPAEHANRRGIRWLRRHGIEVDVGVGESWCTALHEHYLHHVGTGRPFVTLKAATSLDGRIATASGDSKWITSEAARREGHRLRARHHAIAVGVETVLADDPSLTVRLARGHDPMPIVFDSKLRLGGPKAPGRAVLREGTLVLHTSSASGTAQRRLVDRGVETLSIRADSRGRVDVDAALRTLGKRSVRSLLVEGGGRLLGSFVQAQCWQQFYLFQAPRLLGEGRPLLGGVSWPTVEDAPTLRVESRRRLDQDLLTILRP
jgi:diaminohydroxyphosphoribosylaminopyrimidine deaminase/5-amino-6-(5-phosphoribosylamino)uracil reductase